MKDIIVKQFFLFNQNFNKDLNIIENNLFMVYDSLANLNFEKAKNYDLKSIIWKYDNNNYRIPYFNYEKIQVIKLNEKQNVYDFISSSSIIPYSEIISGEKLLSLADVFIGNSNSLNANPNTSNFIKNKININSINNLNPYNKIFIKTDDLVQFYNKFDITNKTIITHNSDYEISASFINQLEKCKLQLSQNCLFKHPKLIPLSIGIENSMWFNHELLEKVRIRTDIIKDKEIYFYFSLNTHNSRKECYEKLKNKLTWNTKLSKEDYFIELKRHKYAICPRGNGLDTHRLWECLYLDVIPIMLKKDSVNIDNLPIIYLDDWNDLDISKLDANFKNLNMSKITIDYYNNIINI